MTDRSSSDLVKASRLLEKLVHRSTQLKRTLKLNREQEGLFKQLQAGLRRLQRLVDNAPGANLRQKGSAEIWITISRFFIRVIDILSRLFEAGK